MPVTVRIPTPLRKHAEGARSADMPTGSVAEVLQALAARYPAMRASLFAADGAPREDLRLFVGSADIRSLEGAETAVREGETLSIVPPVAGA